MFRFTQTYRPAWYCWRAHMCVIIVLFIYHSGDNKSMPFNVHQTWDVVILEKVCLSFQINATYNISITVNTLYFAYKRVEQWYPKWSVFMQLESMHVFLGPIRLCRTQNCPFYYAKPNSISTNFWNFAKVSRFRFHMVLRKCPFVTQPWPVPKPKKNIGKSGNF